MTNKKIETRPWDAAERLRDEEGIRLYIEAAMEEAPDDAAFIAMVLGDVARARNICGCFSLALGEGVTGTV